MTTFERDLLEVMGGLTFAIDRQTEAFRVATDSQRDAVEAAAAARTLADRKIHAQVERQFRYYSGLLTAPKPDEEEPHSEHPMD